MAATEPPQTQQKNSISPGTKTLYCVAYEKYVRGEWVAGLEYMHASNANGAIIQLGGKIGKRGMGILLGRSVKIVGIAPVIGAFAKDNHGEKLVV